MMRTIGAQQATELKAKLLDAGASELGFCDLSLLAETQRGYFHTGISILVAMQPEVIAGLGSGPTRDYIELYHHANATLDRLSNLAAATLEQWGARTDRWGATGDRIDKTTQSTALPHKTLATLSGLGWVGKCALLITPQFGAAVRLTSVLFDLSIDSTVLTDAACVQSRCGECRICVDICPVSALSGATWKPGIEREALLDFQSCRTFAKQISHEKTGIASAHCGRCLFSCPWTQRYLKSSDVSGQTL